MMMCFTGLLVQNTFDLEIIILINLGASLALSLPMLLMTQLLKHDVGKIIVSMEIIFLISISYYICL